jgi:hypothetical protein
LIIGGSDQLTVQATSTDLPYGLSPTFPASARAGSLTYISHSPSLVADAAAVDLSTLNLVGYYPDVAEPETNLRGTFLQIGAFHVTDRGPRIFAFASLTFTREIEFGMSEYPSLLVSLTPVVYNICTPSHRRCALLSLGFCDWQLHVRR